MLNTDLALVTESWLNENSFEGHLKWQDFSFFSRNRQNKKGGGVCLWCKNKFKPNLINHRDHKNLSDLVDILPISFCTDSSTIALILLYIPPSLNNNSDIEILLCDWIDMNIKVNQYDDLIICGDVNRTNLDILQGEYNLCNVIRSATRGNAVLDKVYFSQNLINLYTNILILDPIASSDHSAILISTNGPSKHVKKAEVKSNYYYDFRQADLTFIHYHSDILFNDSPCDNINQLSSSFYKSIYDILGTIPCKLIRRTHKDKPWISDKIKGLINDRWKAYRSKNYSKYVYLKDKVKKEIVSAKENWLTQKRQKDSNMWNVVRFVEGKHPTSKMYSEDQLDEITAIAKTLYYNKEENSITENTALHANKKVHTSSIYQFCINALTSLDVKKSVGIDNVPNKFYKTFLPYIIEPLSHFISQILSTCSFPDNLKQAYIIPIPKKTSSDTKNFRPISILNTLARLVEKVLFLYYEDTIYQSYGENQFGFRSGSSTTIALIYIFQCIKSIMEQSSTSGCLLIAIDLSKAFDNINHSTLIHKLRAYTHSSYASLISSYLSNRSAKIKIGENCSDPISINKGVPQGSCLGPALFCTYISDLKPALSSNVLVKYADDLTLIMPITGNIENDIDIEMKNIVEWCDRNDMKINLSKTQALPIIKQNKSFSTTKIQCTNEICLLGFTFDDKQSFNSHFHKAVSKASKNIYLIKQLKNIIPAKDLNSIFSAKIKSVVEYGLPAIPHISSSSLYLINRLYKRCNNLIFGNSSSINQTEDKRKHQAFKLFKQIITDPTHILHSFLPTRSKTGRFILPAIPTQRSHDSFFNQCAFLFNLDFVR